MSSMDSRQERVTTPSLLKDQSKGAVEGNTDEKEAEKDNHSKEEHLEHNGRALNVIIDNDSGMNMISETAVKRLRLKTENHPTSYRINWVNEANLILVKQRCLVKFSLGKKYMDEAWCDVIPMTICHMLLGRPWLYDRKVIYDGYANTYSFTFKGKEFVLDPLQILEFEARKKTVPVLTMRQFSRVLHEGDMLLMVIKREVQQVDGNIPTEFTTMLEEFQDTMLCEVSNQLSQMREVQHDIDLIPGSTLPNLPHYRMSPAENEVLSRKIQQLLDKGFIEKVSALVLFWFYSHQRRMVVGGYASIAEQLIRYP
ncbi:hypothetical protein CK203_022204 [Vitis vinifera]|uniref:Uncharacterized protein n=1 Tax=Vitis vinifera TaxID=29760 RepID=A0A438FZJ5_VITVI|nr:hypothetical protein CK203_022204 [Vitis vinifera]